MDCELTVGNNRGGLQDGSTKVVARAGRTGELTVGFAHEELYEASSRGNLFVGSTAIAGVAPGTVLSTTPPIVLYNPPNSGVMAILSILDIGFLSGTLGAGNIVLAAIGNQAISVANLGTDLVPITTAIGGNTRPSCRLLQAPTLSAAPTLIKNIWYTGAFVTNATAYFPQVAKILRGEYTILPGGTICMQGIAGAGTNPLVLFSMTWEEVPLVFNK